MRKRLLAQIAARRKQDIPADVEGMDADLRTLLDTQVSDLKQRIESKHSPWAVWRFVVVIVYRVSLWTHTRTSPACKFYRFLTRVVGAGGPMMRRSGSLRKALAMA
jgi:hypothetical protein